MMAMYRERPVEAVQWWPPGDVRHADYPFVYLKFAPNGSFVNAFLRQPWSPNMPGAADVFAGDWIVTNPDRSRTVWRPEKFAAHYELAE